MCFLHYTGSELRDAAQKERGLTSAISIVSGVPLGGAESLQRRRDMKFQRVWALIERDMRKFFRSPALMMASMMFPLVQLIVLGYAFGGKIKGADIGFRRSGSFRGIAAGPRNVQRHRRRARKPFASSTTTRLPRALDDLQTAGFVRGVVESLTIFRGDSTSTTGRASPSPKTIPTSLFPARSSSAFSKWSTI